MAAHPAQRLERAALAAWYARQQQLRFSAPIGTQVPASVMKQADGVKNRMLKVLDYAFGDDPNLSPEIAMIRSGQGYQDTANDLQQLADLYATPDVARVIEHDRIHYHSSDVSDAREIAGKIFTALGHSGPDAAEWTDLTQRAYTHLANVYAEHVYAGQFLFFRTEDVSDTYPPSLVTVVRSSRHASGSSGAANAPAIPAPTATSDAATGAGQSGGGGARSRPAQAPGVTGRDRFFGALTAGAFRRCAGL